MSRASDPAWCAVRAPQLRLRSCSLAVSLATLAVLLQPHAYADTSPLSLDETIERALTQAPEIAASSAMAQGARAVTSSAEQLPDPELIVGVDNLPINTADRFSFTRDFMTMRKIGVMQTFPNGRKRRLQSERAEREITSAEAQLRAVRFDTARAASEAWISRAVAEESLARLRDLRPEADLQAAAARAGLASGRTSAAEALAMQLLVARTDERILALEQDLEMRRAELARWVSDSGERPLAQIPVDRELGSSIEALLEAVPGHAPVASLVSQVAAAQSDVALARAEKRPDWSAELTYAERGSDFSDMISLEFRVGLPFFARHRQDPVIAEKVAIARAREAERDAGIRMHTAEVQAAASEWRLGRKRLQHYAAELLPLARDRSRTAVASYAAGRGDLRGATEALTEEIDLQLDHVQLQSAVARAWTFLHFLHDPAGVSK